MIANNYIKPFVVGLIGFLLLPSIAQAATFKLTPANEIFAYNCESKIDIIVNSESKQSNTAEIEISFDKDIITIIDSNNEMAGIQIEKGKAYSAFILNTVNETTGKINIVATSLPQDFNGNEIFATIHFRSKNTSSSTTQFSILFNGIGKTLDSNIADTQTGLDILTSTQDAEVTFSGTEECIGITSAAVPSTTQAPSIAPTSAPQTLNSMHNNLSSINNFGNLPFGLFNLLSGSLLLLLLGNLIYWLFLFFAERTKGKYFLGIAYDAITHNPINKANINIYNAQNELIGKSVTDKFGRMYSTTSEVVGKVVVSRFDHDAETVTPNLIEKIEYVGLKPNENSNPVIKLLTILPIGISGMLILALMIALFFTIGILL